MLIEGKRVLIAGSSGSGKSYFVEHNILKSILAKDKNASVLIFDPEPSWKIDGFKVLENIKDLVDHLKDCYGGSFQVIFKPNRHGNIKLDAHNVAKLIDINQNEYLATEGKKGNPVYLIVDETHFVVTNSNEYYGFEMLARTGRKRGIFQYYITQGLKDLPPFIRNNLNSFVCFKLSLTANADIQTLKTMVGNSHTEQLFKASEFSYLKSDNNKIELIKGKV